jgi:hypothetical protein
LAALFYLGDGGAGFHPPHPAPLRYKAHSAPARRHALAGLYACGVGSAPSCGETPGWELEDAVLSSHRGPDPCGTLEKMSAPWTLFEWPAYGWAPPPPPPPPPAPAAEGAAGAPPPLPPSPPGCLVLGHRHVLRIVTRNASGARLCAGGAYIEGAVEGEGVRVRARVRDEGDGTYAMEVLLPDDPLLAGGEVRLRARSMFQHFGGLTLNEWWIYNKNDDPLLDVGPFTLLRAGEPCGAPVPPARLPPPQAPPAVPCTTLDFMAEPFWEGHWLRLPEAPGQGLPRGMGAPAAACPPGACAGDGRLAWSRWVYRLPACYFYLFPPAEARACLNGSHVWGSGDSNLADTQRNLLAHVLALDVDGWLMEEAVDDFVLNGRSNDLRGARYHPRSPHAPTADTASPLWPAEGAAWAAQAGDGRWAMGRRARPPAPHLVPPPGSEYNMSFRFSAIFNAAPVDTERNYGLATVYSGAWRGRHEAAWAGFSADRAPPTLMFINSGLHDGLRFSGHQFALKDYLLVADDMVAFWEGLRDAGPRGAPGDGGCVPRTVWRHTVAPAGVARPMKSNPQKMEVFNRLMAGRLTREGRGKGGRHPRVHPSCGGRPFLTPPQAGGGWAFLDAFDMTFPWHHDNTFSDGGHYGRYWCNTNEYARCDFVDLFMIHVLLNGLCEAGGG